jgi:hypothetical protein
MTQFRTFFLSGLMAGLIAGSAFPQEEAPETTSSSPEVVQEIVPSTIPQTLFRPQRGESPRYPRDMIIGELGRGDAPEGAYSQALRFLSALLQGDPEGPDLSGLGTAAVEDYLEALKAVEPAHYRIGGGKTEPDGGVSFLVRFLGREKWISGELYLLLENEQWKIDDLILEDPRQMTEGKDPYRFNLTPYERFY